MPYTTVYTRCFYRLQIGMKGRIRYAQFEIIYRLNMGYELSIQREENQIKLTKEEWIDYIKSDSEFHQIEEFSAEIDDGKSLTVSTPNAGLWKTDNGEVPFTFDEEYGWISVKNPDERIIKKMISIAHDLDSVVLGEEGEKYDEKNLLGEQAKDDYKSDGRKWWQFWKT